MIRRGMSEDKIRCHLIGGPSDGARFTHAPRVTTIKIPTPTSLGYSFVVYRKPKPEQRSHDGAVEFHYVIGE